MIPMLLVASCSASDSPPDAADLVGTWDYELDEADAQLIVDDFEGLVGSADTVVVRVGFDGSEYWLGFLFDGELMLVDGVPEGDGGTYHVDGDNIVMTGAHGAVKGTSTWDVDGDELTITWVKQCSVASQEEEEVCVTDRAELATVDPLTLTVWEHTFTRSGDDPDY